MPDYSKSKIYRIFCGEEQYIGSTIRPLSERMNEHRKSYKNGHLKCSSRVLFEKYGLENCKIELVEDYPCERKEQLHKREGEIQRERRCVNNNIAGRPYNEWVAENKEHLTEYHKQWYSNNKERIIEYHKKYNLENTEKIAERQRQKYLNNQETIKERMRQYRLDNPEKMKEQDRQKYLRNKNKKSTTESTTMIERETH